LRKTAGCSLGWKPVSPTKVVVRTGETIARQARQARISVSFKLSNDLRM
jgi:hypothetical protein